jgi:hypothetical protein
LSRVYRPCAHGGEPVGCLHCIARREQRRVTRLRDRRSRPESVRASNLWQMYRIRVSDYEALLEAQDHRCASCGVHEDDVNRAHVGGVPRQDGTPSPKPALVVDHCHQSGVIRALLCSPCNRVIGHAQDDPERLEAAARYLRRAPTTTLSAVGGNVWRKAQRKAESAAIAG